MTDQQPLYQLRDLSKTYTRGKESISIFKGLDMDIQHGDFIAIMGPSGSGKTTLLNQLGGIDSPSSGQVVFEGKRIDNLSQGALAKWRSRNVGFIFQFYNLMPTLSAAQNVELPLLLTGLSGGERKKRVKTALEIVGIADRAGHKPRQLSGGQQQRVAIARAIVADPKILLADEPTGDLDRTTADEILGMLQQLNTELGKTIVMVTHDPSAAKYAKRELYLDKGEFVERGNRS
ncbi:ABC transporter ATP-binding protein [Hyphobacterium sp. SN044]|uniref:ABC transporter ATP-binding protein n=1 Tax=Hyphobacterium sp. SN044 TaxID=2912575 RepID=UPI001F290D16|nr:ABC transporter ATP-binding protein [Hyphobacterium sp. SN044]MCF8879745.1 ABC transporter ATP-binding protein [Hyphobacterium sp. SN044]